MSCTDILLKNHWYLPFLIGLLGLVAGSFLNVVIHRLPIMITQANNRTTRQILEQPYDEEVILTLNKPRSFCMTCHQKIPIRDNIPLCSYLLLRGKSRCCSKPISLHYPMVEMLTALCSLVLALHFGPTLTLGAALLLTWSLIALFFIDLQTFLLPDHITLPLLWLGLLFNTFHCFTRSQDAIWGAITGFAFFYLLAFVMLKVRKIQGLGDGDLKLIASLGAWLGWQLLPALIFIASLGGSVAGIVYLLKTKRKLTTQLPFGPFLSFAGFVMLTWGEKITHIQNTFFQYKLL